MKGVIVGFLNALSLFVLLLSWLKTNSLVSTSPEFHLPHPTPAPTPGGALILSHCLQKAALVILQAGFALLTSMKNLERK